MLTERDVHRLLGTDLPVHRLVLGEEFDVWALGTDLIAKFSRTPYDADKVPLEHSVHPLLRELLGPVVPDVHSVGEMDEPGLRFIVQERATGIQGQGADGVTATAGDGLAEHVGWLLGRLHTVEAEEVFATGDRCVVRWVYRWVREGKPGHVRGVDLFRIADGRVAEKLSYVKG